MKLNVLYILCIAGRCAYGHAWLVIVDDASTHSADMLDSAGDTTVSLPSGRLPVLLYIYDFFFFFYKNSFYQITS